MKHTYRFQVHMQDTDAAGVVFFARLFSHAHDVYEDFLNTAGQPLSQLIASGMHLPIAHASADYLAPIRLGEEVVVSLQVEKLGECSFTLSYELFSGSEICAKLRTVHVFVLQKSSHSAPLPEVLRQVLRPYCV